MYLSAWLFTDVIFKRDWEPRSLSVMKLVCEFYMVNNIVEYCGVFLQVREQPYTHPIVVHLLAVHSPSQNGGWVYRSFFYCQIGMR